jgi:hypothetical protein
MAPRLAASPEAATVSGRSQEKQDDPSTKPEMNQRSQPFHRRIEKWRRLEGRCFFGLRGGDESVCRFHSFQ